MNGTVQVNDKVYHLSKSKIYDFFVEIKINLGSEKTYEPLLCGECSSRYTLHLKSGKVIKYLVIMHYVMVLHMDVKDIQKRLWMIYLNKYMKVIDSF